MGYEEIPGIKIVDFKDLSAGWFPGKEHNEIPGDFTTPNEPLGMVEGDNVLWNQGKLNKMHGFDNVNTTALNGGAVVTSLFHSIILDEMIATAGDKIYNNANTTTPDDITGAITITPDIQIQWLDWVNGANKYIIGLNGTDLPIKWDGGATADILGGTPPVGRWIVEFKQTPWIAGIAATLDRVYYSTPGDPETWDANDYYAVGGNITGLGVLGNMLVAFKENSIAVISGGSNNLGLMQLTENYILGKGCNAGHSIRNCLIQGREVLVFHGKDGFYAFDGSQTLIRLSSPINKKYTGGNVTKFNENRFEYAHSTYSKTNGWYLQGMSDGGDSQNKFLILLDLDIVLQNNEGTYVPHWPIDTMFDATDVSVNCIITANIDSSVDELFFGGNDGFIYKFDNSIFNRNGTAYTGYFKSKIVDAVESWIVQEANILGDQEATTLGVYINADQESGDGELDTIDFAGDDDLLDTTFIIGTSVFGGKDFKFNFASILNFGRFFQFKLSNAVKDKPINTEQVNFVLQGYGIQPNVAEV